MGHNGHSQVSKSIKPAPVEFKHRKNIKNRRELAIALQQAFNHGFDEGPHWAQVSSYE